MREFFFALADGCGDAAEDALALKGRQAASGAEGFDGGGYGGFRMLLSALRDAGDEAAIIRSVNLDDIAILLPTAIHKKTMRRNRRDRHLCHDVWAPRTSPSIIIGLGCKTI
jgi:hypothetical protein